MKLETLIRSLDPLAVHGVADVEVTGVTCDSRQVRPGFVFVAVPGTHADGWTYVAGAVKRGAVAVVSERDELAPSPACTVRVRDARRALARLACVFHGFPADRLQVVGVTGTNGKTTVAFLCRDLLKAAGREPGLIGTVEYQIGQRVIPAGRTTPEATSLQDMLAQMLAAGCRSAVMEVSSHALDQRRVEGIDFDVAVFTNLTRDHLDYHHTMEAYFEAKCLLFDGLGHGAKSPAAVINLDDPWGRRLAERPGLRARLITFGLQTPADVAVTRLDLGREGSHVEFRSPWGTAAFRLPLLGRYNVSNALAALAAGGALGISLDVMIATLSRCRAAPGRLEEIPTGLGFQVFVDYAHTDDALAHALGTLRELSPKRLLVVFGCGGNRDRTKRPLMGAVASRLADYAILTSDNPRSEQPADIIAEIRAGFDDPARVETIEDRAAAIQRALELAQPGDIVLVAGKGHETFQEFAHTLISFDDRQVIRNLLACQASPQKTSRNGATASGTRAVPA